MKTFSFCALSYTNTQILITNIYYNRDMSSLLWHKGIYTKNSYILFIKIYKTGVRKKYWMENRKTSAMYNTELNTTKFDEEDKVKTDIKIGSFPFVYQLYTIIVRFV